MAIFLSLYSGSSGNCALVGEQGRYLCVDMGKNCKTTLAALVQADVDPQQLAGILVTHEHTDHTKGLEVFLKRYHLPVYGSAGTLDYLALHGMVPAGADLRALREGEEEIEGFGVRSFHTSHDAADCRGFRIVLPSGRVAAMATDLGIVTDEVLGGLLGADLAILEANYDPVRLRTGPYPYYLKARIASQQGHLCNEETGGALVQLLAEGCERFALCHLSQENNTPQLAMQAVTQAFIAAGSMPGQDGLLQVLSRGSVTPAIHF